MGSLGAILKHPADIYPLLKLKMAAKHAEKQIPPEPHWAFCYSMLHRVSRSFALVIQQLDTELRNAVSIISIAFSCVICLVLISLPLFIWVLGCDYLLIMGFFFFFCVCERREGQGERCVFFGEIFLVKRVSFS